MIDIKTEVERDALDLISILLNGPNERLALLGEWIQDHYQAPTTEDAKNKWISKFRLMSKEEAKAFYVINTAIGLMFINQVDNFAKKYSLVTQVDALFKLAGLES